MSSVLSFRSIGMSWGPTTIEAATSGVESTVVSSASIGGTVDAHTRVVMMGKMKNGLRVNMVEE